MPGELGFDTGPFVNIAAFCERVLQEQDGVLSMIRVIDQIFLPTVTPIPESTLVAQATLAVMLKPGEARGSHQLKVEIELPSTLTRPVIETSIAFVGGPNNGTNVVLPMQITVESEGLYWANISVNDRLVSRVPLQITYQLVRMPTPPA